VDGGDGDDFPEDWYSPLLFARRWTILMGYDPDDIFY
jgi:hypothetical protein